MLSPRSSALNSNSTVIGVVVPANAERFTLPVLHPVWPQVSSPPGKKQSPISVKPPDWLTLTCANVVWPFGVRSEEHTSELQSQSNLVCRLLLEKKKKKNIALNMF